MPRKIVVACGGTGGHALPGLAVARELKARGHDVALWSSGRDVEGSALHDWVGPVFATGARQLSAFNSFANFFAILRCLREIKRFKPDAMLAMGSYSSLPPVLAARMQKVPVVLHEANTVPGKAVSFLSRYAKCVAISFPETASRLKGRRTELTGLPVREGIDCGKRFDMIPENAFTVFVTGGSQGAHRVNELMGQALVLLKEDFEKTNFGRPLFVIHQTGAADEGAVMARYAAAGLKSRVQAFEREMASAFASADIVVARAGASTCFELAKCGKPALLIPLPTAVRDHQHYNAQAFVRGHAADEGIQKELTGRSIERYIMHKATHPEELARMSAAMKVIGEHSAAGAAGRVASLVENIGA